MSRQQFIDELTAQCDCLPVSDRPCAGLLAGGLCDKLNLTGRDEFDDPEDSDMEDVDL